MNFKLNWHVKNLKYNFYVFSFQDIPENPCETNNGGCSDEQICEKVTEVDVKCHDVKIGKLRNYLDPSKVAYYPWSFSPYFD